MEEQFVSYELALQLKELGCDVKTFAYYDMEGKLYPMGTIIGPEEIYFGIFNPNFQYKPQLESLVSAPLWQQAFDWFRTEHDLISGISPYNEKFVNEHKIAREFEPSIVTKTESLWLGSYHDYDMAKVDLLIQLIEILNGRNNSNTDNS